MSKILYVGDLHGEVDAVAAVDQLGAKIGAVAVVQVGDLAILWPKDRIAGYFRKRARQGKLVFPWYTCGGNHEQWVKWLARASEAEGDLVELAPGCSYVKRGSFLEIAGVTHAFLGGAESVDRHQRIDRVTWFEEETPSRVDFERFYDALVRRPEVVVTHDAPLEVSFFGHGDRREQTTPRMLQRCLEISEYRPPLYFFGHHHAFESWLLKGTRYFCCGLGGQGFAMDLDGNRGSDGRRIQLFSAKKAVTVPGEPVAR